jgi:HK97 gp10 family phage protein
VARAPEVNRAEVDRQLRYNPDVTSSLEKIAKAVVRDAQAAAPKRTGAGAKSITHEYGHDQDGPFQRVSWDRRHYYMQFHEFGTSRMNAHPFLRPAAQKPRGDV